MQIAAIMKTRCNSTINLATSQSASVRSAKELFSGVVCKQELQSVPANRETPCGAEILKRSQANANLQTFAVQMQMHTPVMPMDFSESVELVQNQSTLPTVKHLGITGFLTEICRDSEGKF